MTKTQKELAFIREFHIGEEWTKRFTNLLDKHVKFADEENILYVNAGTGDHVLSLRDKIRDKTAVFATCEDEHLLNIARDKAAAVRSNVDFSMMRFDDNAFDRVLAEASFVPAVAIGGFIENAVRVTRTSGNVAILLITAGSFGEIFSLLWEVLYSEDLGEHGAAAEKMITDLPTVSRAEEIAEKAGLIDVKTHTANEIFEFENGAEFVGSPLMSDFLLPGWFESLDEKEKERVMQNLAQLVDAEDGTLTFRFSVKATLITGAKS